MQKNKLIKVRAATHTRLREASLKSEIKMVRIASDVIDKHLTSFMKGK